MIHSVRSSPSQWILDGIGCATGCPNVCLFFPISAPSKTLPTSLLKRSPFTATKNFPPFSLPTLRSYPPPNPHSFFLPIVSIALLPILLCQCSASVPRSLDSRLRRSSTFCVLSRHLCSSSRTPTVPSRSRLQILLSPFVFPALALPSSLVLERVC